MIVPESPPGSDMSHRPWESPEVGHPEGVVSGKVQITHDAIIDFLVANPRATRRQIADAFGYRSEASISVILNADAFQARMAARREGIIDPILVAKLEDRMKGLVSQSMTILERKLETSDDANLALKVFDSTTKAAGYGLPKNAPVVQNQFVVQLPGPARSSAEWLQSIGAPQTVEVLEPLPDRSPSEAESG